MNHRDKAIILSAVTAVASWLILPGTFIDRALISATCQITKNGDHLLTGNGKTANPYNLVQLSSAKKTPNSPTVISIGQDPDRVFQASPPSPIDFAIILRNIHRLGGQSPAIATTLSWAEPDIISLTALDQQLDSFQKITTSAPLTRSPISTPIPPAFRRASIPLSEVYGNTNLLPTVNNLATPDAILGKNTSTAGFSSIESQPQSSSPQLLAAWDDRLIFSFSLITTLNHTGNSTDSVKVRLGEYISLGKNAPIIPIDEFGRLRTTVQKTNQTPTIPAQNLIDGDQTLLPQNSQQPLILKSDQTLPDHIQTIATLKNIAAGATTTALQRIRLLDLAILSAITFLLFSASKSGKIQKLLFLAIPIILISSYVTCFQKENLLIPVIPGLLIAAIATTYLLLREIERQPAKIPNDYYSRPRTDRSSKNRKKRRLFGNKKSGRKSDTVDLPPLEKLQTPSSETSVFDAPFPSSQSDKTPPS